MLDVLFDRFFSYSLEGRIKPRHKILRSKDIVLHLRSMLACNDEIFDQRVNAALERRSRGMSSDEGTELETGGEEMVQEQALTTDWVPSIWGALRGDGSEDADMVDFDASTAWVDEEDRLDSEEDNAAFEESGDEQLSGETRIQNDSRPYRMSSEKLASESEDKWSSEGGDVTEEAHLDDNENERLWEEEDDSIVGEDIDFLMKYCV
jgi:hypothetical protein